MIELEGFLWVDATENAYHSPTVRPASAGQAHF